MIPLRSFFRFTLALFFALCLVACGSGGGSSNNYGDILHDKAAMAKLTDAIKDLGKGKEVMIFQDVTLSYGSIMFSMQDPDKPDSVVHQTWHMKNGWSVAPVTLTGDGRLEDNLTPMSEFNFPAIVDFVLACEKLLADKGYKDTRVDSANIRWNWNDGSLSLMTATPIGEPGTKQANFEGTIDGKVTKAWTGGYNKATEKYETENLM